jgi:hypothetical protein
VDDFAIEQRHHTFQAFDLLIGALVEVAVPRSNACSLAYFEGTDLIFEKHLSRTPSGVADSVLYLLADGSVNENRRQLIDILDRVVASLRQSIAGLDGGSSVVGQCSVHIFHPARHRR